MIHSPMQLWLPAWLCAVALLIAAPASIGDTLLLAKWDNPDSLDATYSLMGSTAFTNNTKWRDHGADEDNRDGNPHTAGVEGKWNGGRSIDEFARASL